MTVLKTGLIGAHISRSRFSAALEILCERHGFELDFVTIDTAEISGFDFEQTVRDMQQSGRTGVSVTHPYKLNARSYAGSSMTKDQSHLQASNLLIFKPEMTAFNTDYSGFLSAMATLKSKQSGAVLMLGAGGVASAIAPALVAQGIRVYLFDTDPKKASQLSANIGDNIQIITAKDLPELAGQADGLINATPVGTEEYPGSAFDRSWIGQQKWAFDAVYTPIWTGFLTFARQKGLECLTGFDLFRAMAVQSFAHLTGRPVEPELMALLDPLKPT